jgi:hypothetical protein
MGSPGPLDDGIRRAQERTLRLLADVDAVSRGMAFTTDLIELADAREISLPQLIASCAVIVAAAINSADGFFCALEVRESRILTSQDRIALFVADLERIATSLRTPNHQ